MTHARFAMLTVTLLFLTVLSIGTPSTILVNTTTPMVGEEILITLSNGSRVDTVTTYFEVATPSTNLRWMDPLNAIEFPLTFTPLEAGEYTFQIVDRESRGVLTGTVVHVIDAAPTQSTTDVIPEPNITTSRTQSATPEPIVKKSNDTNNSPTLSVKPSVVSVGDFLNVTVLNAHMLSTILIEVASPSRTIQYRSSTLTPSVEFFPLEAGTHTFTLLHPSTREPLTSAVVSVNVSTVRPSGRLFVKDSQKKKVTARVKLFKRGQQVFDSRINTSAVPEDTYDIELTPAVPRVVKVKLHDVNFSGDLSLGMEEIKKPLQIRNRTLGDAFAIDPTNLSFTNGSITKVATGTELWKCVEWNFTTQICFGEWVKILTLTPGENYTVTFNATDPGFAETNITILNVKSLPQVGGNWTVQFNTTGVADLSIRAVNGTTWSLITEEEDLKFLSLTCGGAPISYAWINNSVFVQDYSCNATGEETSLVITRGRHDLEFTFGTDTKYAQNYAAATGLLMLRDDTGGQSTADNTVGNNITWDQQDRIDSPFAHNTGEANITVLTTGLYRISYGIAVRQTGGGRIEDNSRVYRNDFPLAACRAQSYTRGGTSTQDGAMTSDCLVELTANDVIWLNSLRTSDTTTAETTVADRTWFHMQLVEEPDVFMAHDEGGGQDMDQTAGTVLTWDTSDRVDSTYTFTTDANNVTVLQSGLYRITYGIAVEHTSDVRVVPYGEILINDSQIPVGYSSDFQRGANDARNGVIVADALVELGENATIKIRGGRSGAVSESSTVTTANATWFHVERIPDANANVVMVYEAGGGESLDSTSGVDIAWDTTQREDSFFNVTDTNTIEVLRDGYYRIAYNVYNDRPIDPTDGTRVELLGNLRISGADTNVCWSSGYNRGDEGSGGDAYEGAQSASCIVNLSAGQDLEIRMRRSSSTSAVIRNVGDRTWWYIQALDAINTIPFTNITSPPNATVSNISLTDFNFTTIDNESATLTCTLYGNFTGTWGVNASTTATNDTNTNITVDLSDGYYEWNVLCVDENTGASFSEDNSTITIDTVPPVISDVQNNSITDSSAVINWMTDEQANSTAEYGETESLGSREDSATMVTTHGLALTGLSASTLYYYNVTSCDPAGNCNQTGPYNFTTGSEPDTSPPIFYNASSIPGETTANIYWNTSEASNSTVNYDTTPTLSLSNGSALFVTEHNILLSSLTPKTFYYYNVTSCDPAGNCNQTGTFNFTTIDSTPPTVTLVSPQNMSTTDLAVNLTFNVTDNVLVNVTNCSLYINSTGEWILNETQHNLTQGINQSFERSLPPGTYLWNVYCSDLDGNAAFATNNRTVTTEDQPMALTPIQPTQNALTGTSVFFECTVTDDFGLLSVSLYNNRTGAWVLNETKNVTGISATVNFTKPMPIGYFQWACRATDEFGQRQYSTNTSWYVDDRTMLVENSLNDTVLQPGSSLRMFGNVTLSDGANVTHNILNITRNGTSLNPENSSESSLIERDVNPTWWKAQYKHREQLNITNQNTTTELPHDYTINLTYNTQNLTTLSLLNTNGSDFRIVYWNGTENIELDRLNETPFDTTTTQIHFRLQDDIAASATDSNYYVYYANPDAGTPPNETTHVYSPFQTMRISAVDEDWQTVTLDNDYEHPVIIAHVEETAVPTEEVVSRITNISGNTFAVRVQNPGGNPFVDRNLTLFVLEAGIYRLEDGTVLEAQRIEGESAVVGSGTTTPSTYDTITYEQSFPGAPAVITQVMSFNDSLWVGDHTDSITATTAGVALEMGQYCDTGGACPNAEGHDPEDLGVLIFERTTGTVGGVTYEADTTAVNINGATDSTGCFNTALSASFTGRPLTAADINTRNGGDGGWATTCLTTSTTLGLVNMEEDESDGERSHGGTESATYLVVESESVLPIINDFPTAPSVAVGAQELRVSRTDEYGAFNYTFTAPVTEGTYSVLVNTSLTYFTSWNFTFFHVDGTAPFVAVSVLDPNPAELGQENVSFNWTVTDPHLDLAYANITYPNGTLLAQVTENTTLTTLNLTVRGNYNITVFAYDLAGNFNTTNDTLIVQDTTPPTVSLQVPLNDTWQTQSPVVFTHYVFDYDNVSSCTLWHNGTGTWAANSTNSSSINGALNNLTSELPDGVFVWNVLCNDTLSNSAFAQANWTVKVDTTAPNVSLEEPLNNTLNTSTNNILFTYNVSDSMTDVASCVLVIDGEQKGIPDVAITEGTTQNFTAFIDNGDHNWSVNCTDTNGFTGESQMWNISVAVVDETDPPVITLNHPSDGAFLSVNNITFNYTAEDATGIDNCSIYIDGVLNLTNTSVTTNDYNYFEIGNFTETNHTWQVQCFDNNTGVEGLSSTYNFTIDLTDPVVTLEEPPDASFVTVSTVELNYSVADVNILNCSLYSNFTGVWGLNQSDLSPSNSSKNTFTSTLADGPYSWNVFCSDASERNTFSTENYTLKVDTLAPIIASNATHPSSPATYAPGQFYFFNATIVDAFVDTVYIEHNFTGVLQNESVTDVIGTTYKYNTTDLAIGTYTFSWWVNDSIGRTGFLGSFDYVVMQEAGTVNLTLNGTQGNISIVEDEYVNMSALLLTPTDGYLELYMNGALLTNGISPLTNVSRFSVPGTYNITVVYNETQNYTSGTETHYIIVNDTVDPNVTTLQPENDTIVGTRNVVFVYNVTDLSALTNCSLYINGTLNQTDMFVTKGVEQTFSETLQDGNWTYQIQCFDTTGNEGLSDLISFNVIDSTLLNVSVAADQTQYEQGQDAHINVTTKDRFVNPLQANATSTIIYTNTTTTTIPWWNTSYLHRQPLNITNNEAGDLPAGYSIQLFLNTSDPNMQTDGEDLRIAYFNRSNHTVQEIARFNESPFDSDSTELWFMLQDTVLGSSTTFDYFIYYGNSTVTNPPEDPLEVFLWYQTFEENVDGWTNHTSTGIIHENSGGNTYALKTFNSDPGGGYVSLTQPVTDFEVEFRSNRVNENGGASNRYAILTSAGNGYGPLYTSYDASSGLQIEERTTFSGSALATGTSLVLSSNEWHTWVFRKLGSDMNFTAYDDTESFLESVAATDATFANENFTRFQILGGYEYLTDDIIVRKLVSTEPTANTTGSEETLVLWVENVTSETQGLAQFNFSTYLHNLGNYSIVTLADKSTFDNGWNHTSFEVIPDSTPPNVTLLAPLNYSWQNASVNLTYFVDDINVQNCTLWHNESGWSADSSNLTPSHGQNNTFTQTFSDGHILWGVHCFDSWNNGAFSENWTVRVDTTPPVVVLNDPEDDANRTSPVTFNWTGTDALATNLSCTLYLDAVLNETGINATSGTPATVNKSFVNLGVVAWNVTCTDENGNTGNSTVYSFYHLTAPLNLTANVAGTVVDILVNWTAVTGADTYNVYIGTNYSAGRPPTANVTGVEETNYTDLTASENQQRYYWVSAVRSEAEAHREGAVGKYDTTMQQDLNLISFPLIPETLVLENGTGGYAFGNLPTCLISLWDMNSTAYRRTDWNGSEFIPASGSDDFLSLEMNKSYWFEANTTCLLTFTGAVPVQNDTRGLFAGANLLSWHTIHNVTLPTDSNPPLIVVDPENAIIAMDRFNPLTDLFEVTIHYDIGGIPWGWWPSFNNQEYTKMDPTQGYFFDSTTASNWTFDPLT